LRIISADSLSCPRYAYTDQKKDDDVFKAHSIISGPCMATPAPAAPAVKGKAKTMRPKIVKRDCCRSVRSFELGGRSLVSKASSVIPSHPAISLSISTVEPHVHSILTLQINVYMHI
jgi:hypothetical protein